GQGTARGPRLARPPSSERPGSRSVCGERSLISGGAIGGAATTVAAVDLGLVRQTALALLTASIAQHHVVRPACSGRFLLGGAGCGRPPALSRRRSSSAMPLLRPKWLASFAGMPAAIRELSCQVLGKTSPVVTS